MRRSEWCPLRELLPVEFLHWRADKKWTNESQAIIHVPRSITREAAWASPLESGLGIDCTHCSVDSMLQCYYLSRIRPLGTFSNKTTPSQAHVDSTRHVMCSHSALESFVMWPCAASGSFCRCITRLCYTERVRGVTRSSLTANNLLLDYTARWQGQ